MKSYIQIIKCSFRSMAAAVLESNIIYLNIVREDERNKGGQVVVQNDAVDTVSTSAVIISFT